jgi:ATP-dependent DNA helicase RecQ
VNNILTTGLSGTTCVLTITNKEALQVAGLLLKNRMPVKLIQSNDGFSLFNLFEVRFFLNQLNLMRDSFVIGDDIWERAKYKLSEVFRNSTRLDLVNNIIENFETTNQKKKYKSDLEVFLHESKLEDFFSEGGETIFVSTVHKSKGKEFDNVFLLLENFEPSTDEKKRQLYVAMTRAKRNLTIHLNGTYLDSIIAGNVEIVDDNETYLTPTELVMHLTHKDVNLGYFEFVQHRMENLVAGDLLVKVDKGYANINDELVLKFSKKFIETIVEQEKRGFLLDEVKVGFLVYWKNEDSDKEVKIILPELYFKKIETTVVHV